MRLLEGSLVLTLSNLTVRIGGYVYRILMGRMLTPYEFGLLNLALPLQYMVVILTSSGIAPSIAKFVSGYEAKKDYNKRDSVISSSLFFYTLLGISFGAAFYILADPIGIYIFHDPNVVKPLKISSMALPFGVLIAVYTGVFQGFKKFSHMSATLVAEQALRIIFALVLVYYGLSAVNAILGSTLGFIATALLAYLLFRKVHQKFSSFSFENFKEVFYFSVPVSATALSAFVLAYIDVILLGFYLTPKEVGIYSAASPTSRLVLAFSTAMYATLLPSISELKALRNYREIKKQIKYAYKLSLLVLIPATLLSIYFSEFIITALFQEDYTQAVRAFEILVVGTAFLGIFTLNSGIFQGLGKPKIPMRILLLAAILDVILNLALIPLYGIDGAALASTLSFIFAGVLSTLVVIKL
ncbi:MAG: flippase [Candidatus Hydrothermarchaeota archaeon]|nr:flippase [Candidatus Hydrothermarchaeota archaeon]